MMFSFGFAIVVTSLGFRDTTGRVKNRGGCERLPFEPSGNHRLEKGDRPSPANPKSLQPHTLYIPGKSKTDKRKSGGMDGNGRYDQQKQRVAGRKVFSLGLMMCDGNAPPNVARMPNTKPGALYK